MSSHHEPFKVLGPVEWADVPQDSLSPFLDDILDQIQTVINSIPPSPSSVSPPPLSETESKLQKEWKEAKVKDNPHNMRVYKLGAKDGKGAWFARSSLHEGLTFDQWKTSLENEFAETMKTTGSPGSGNIRGIGADQRVEHQAIGDRGQLQVFQLSAQFPGPTSPRDFVTLLLTSEQSQQPSKDDTPAMREYAVISKPCRHPECPPRSGFIRGQYESVEIVREVRIPGGGHEQTSSTEILKDGEESNDTSTTAIEWLMITRSDPGGSVPRFMIEKGTPPGIVGDAGKFLKWLSSTLTEELPHVEGEEAKTSLHANSKGESPHTTNNVASNVQGGTTISPAQQSIQDEDGHNSTYSSALYSMITGALGTATSLASGIRKQFSSLEEDENTSESDPSLVHEDATPSESSSIHSFTSAMEKKQSLGQSNENLSISTQSEKTKSKNLTAHEKELEKLEQKRLQLQEKMAKNHERMEQKRQGDQEKDTVAAAKAREKHDKELAKQEEKHRKEMKRLEDRREQEIRKNEERKRKAADKDEKANLSLELEKTRVEREVALKKVKMLEEQLVEMQSQNSDMAAKLAKLGVTEDVVNRQSIDDVSSRSIKST